MMTTKTYTFVEAHTAELVTEREIADRTSPVRGIQPLPHPVQVGLAIKLKDMDTRREHLWRITQVGADVEGHTIEVEVEPADLRVYMVDRLSLIFSALRDERIEVALERVEDMKKTLEAHVGQSRATDASKDIFDAMRLAGLI
jgi:hypothetical protein